MAQEQEIEGGWSGLVASEPTAAANIRTGQNLTKQSPGAKIFGIFSTSRLAAIIPFLLKWGATILGISALWNAGGDSEALELCLLNLDVADSIATTLGKLTFAAGRTDSAQAHGKLCFPAHTTRGK